MPTKQFLNEGYHLCSSHCPQSPAFNEVADLHRQIACAIKEGRRVTIKGT